MSKLEGFFELPANVPKPREAIETIGEMVSKYRQPSQSSAPVAIDSRDGADLIVVPRPVPYRLAEDIAHYLGADLDAAKWPDLPIRARVEVRGCRESADKLMDGIRGLLSSNMATNAFARRENGDLIVVDCFRGHRGHGIDTVLGFLEQHGISYTAKFA